MKIKNYWKVNPIRLNYDTDRDGVPDHKDCEPFNPKKHVKPETMRKAIMVLLYSDGSPQEVLEDLKDARSLCALLGDDELMQKIEEKISKLEKS